MTGMARSRGLGLAAPLFGCVQLIHSILLLPATHTGRNRRGGLTRRPRAGRKGTLMAIADIIIILVIFAAGVAVGIVILVSLGIRREERDFTLTRRAPDQVTRGTRLLTGLYVRQRTDPEPVFAQRPDSYV
jgi:hypothetical protein